MQYWVYIFILFILFDVCTNCIDTSVMPSKCKKKLQAKRLKLKNINKKMHLCYLWKKNKYEIIYVYVVYEITETYNPRRS